MEACQSGDNCSYGPPSLYTTPIPGLYLCSSSMPPGMGLGTYHAAQRALLDLKGNER
jgi:phytoene dehydrogenase-like protein